MQSMGKGQWIMDERPITARRTFCGSAGGWRLRRIAVVLRITAGIESSPESRRCGATAMLRQMVRHVARTEELAPSAAVAKHQSESSLEGSAVGAIIIS